MRRFKVARQIFYILYRSIVVLFTENSVLGFDFLIILPYRALFCSTSIHPRICMKNLNQILTNL